MSSRPTVPANIPENRLDPLHVFRFQVDFDTDPIGGGAASAVPLCSGAFSECTGLEATMEPKVIKEGGRQKPARNNRHIRSRRGSHVDGASSALGGASRRGRHRKSLLTQDPAKAVDQEERLAFMR